MGRGKLKEHGAPEDRFFVGEPRGKVIVIEDVTTTGGSLLTTLDCLKEINVEVLAAISLTNRMEQRDDGKSVEEAIEARGVKYFAMSSADKILPVALEKFKLSKEIKNAIEEEFQRFGIVKIELE
jgi:orotate phosphoribosyltransferase